MKKTCAIFLLFFLFSISSISSQTTRFDMILVGDPILEDLRFLSLNSGTPFLSFSPPLAPGEIRNFIDAIDTERLSAPAQAAYQRVRRRLVPQANISSSHGIFTSLLNINSTIKARVRFNSDVAEYPQNPNIKPFLALPLRLFFAGNLQFYFEPSLTMRPSEYRLDTFDLNIPASYSAYKESMPLRAFAAGGGDWWNFQIGRDRLFWGTGHTGSLIFSDNSQYFTFARLSFFAPRFKYSLIVNQMPLNIGNRYRNIFGANHDPDWWDANHLTRSNHRYFYLHRIDFTLFNRVSIGIMEGVMVGDSPLELRYLNPFMIFHSLFSWEYYERWVPPYPEAVWRNRGRGNDLTGSIFSIEINWNIIRNLAVYGQFVMNEFASPGERGSNPDQPPNALGYMLGVQFAHSFNTWASVFFVEFIYTDPYLGILSTPFASFIQQNRFGQYYHIGFRRDTIALTLGANFFNKDTLHFSGNFSWIATGAHNKGGLTWSWQKSPEAAAETTPTGTAEHKFILSLGAGWRPLSWLVLNANITGIVSHNNNHVAGAGALGGQASFSVSFQY